MKLIRLKLQDFKIHNSTEINFDNVSVFIGDHGQGKSCILDGIEWILTGMCHPMTKRNQEKEVIRTGAQVAVGVLEFSNDQGSFVIKREARSSSWKLFVSDSNGELITNKPEESQNKIFELLGFGKEIAKVLFGATRAATMKPEERKKLLQEMFVSNENKIIEYLEEQGFKKLPDEYKKAIKAAFLAEGLGNDKKGAHGYCVERRREYKRQEEEFKGLKEPDVSNDSKGLESKDVETKISNLNDERDSMLAALNIDTGKSEQLKTTIERLKEELKPLKKKLDSAAQLRMTEHKAGDALNEAERVLGQSKTKSALVADLALVQEQITEKPEVDLTELQESVDKANKELRAAEDDLAKLNDITVPITTDNRLNTTVEVLNEMGDMASKKTIEAVLKKIAELPGFDHAKHQRDIQSVKDWIESYSDEHDKAQKALSDAKENDSGRAMLVERAEILQEQIDAIDCDMTVQDAEKALKTASDEETKAKSAVTSNQDIAKEIDIKESDLKRAEDEYVEPDTSGDSKEVTQEAINQLDTRIAANRKMLEEVISWNQYQTNKDDNLRNLAMIKAKYDNWDEIAKSINPKTCDTSFLLDDSFASFARIFSETSKALGVQSGISADFTVKSNIPVESDSMDSKESDWLSRAQFFRVGIALQLSICKLVDFKALIVDDGDTLIGEARKKLSGMLFNPIDGIDSVILLSAGEAPVKPPKKAGLTFFSVARGVVKPALVPFA